MSRSPFTALALCTLIAFGCALKINSPTSDAIFNYGDMIDMKINASDGTKHPNLKLYIESAYYPLKPTTAVQIGPEWTMPMTPELTRTIISYPLAAKFPRNLDALACMRDKMTQFPFTIEIFYLDSEGVAQFEFGPVSDTVVVVQVKCPPPVTSSPTSLPTSAPTTGTLVPVPTTATPTPSPATTTPRGTVRPTPAAAATTPATTCPAPEHKATSFPMKSPTTNTPTTTATSPSGISSPGTQTRLPSPATPRGATTAPTDSSVHLVATTVVIALSIAIALLINGILQASTRKKHDVWPFVRVSRGVFLAEEVRGHRAAASMYYLYY